MLVLTLLVSGFVVFGATKNAPSYVGFTLNENNPIDPGQCGNITHGHVKLVKDRLGEDRVVMCSSEKPNSYFWKPLDGSSTLGEYFDPVVDCTDVVDKIPDASDGFFWIYSNKLKQVVKVWCDVITDGGGYMLVAKKDNPITWTVPSSGETVDPLGKPHWTSIFGDLQMLDIRFQFSTTSQFKDTKAHWSFRLKNRRRFRELLIRHRGGCTEHNPGIGDIAFVKDLQTGKIVNTNFRCSLFGAHVSPLIGWGMMNKCLQSSCSGFAFIPGLKNVRIDDSGSFSYSANVNSTRSGIWHSSTAFLGCSHGKCCACYGPKGGTDNYCLQNCTAINGGKVSKQVEAWIWIRSSLPKRVWKKCIDFTITGPHGKEEKYRLDEETGIKEKGSCATSEEIKKNGAVLVVPNKATLKKIPPAEGLLVFRPKNQQLFVQGQQGLNEIAMEKEVQGEQQLIVQELKSKQKAFENQLSSKHQVFEKQQQTVEKQLKSKIQHLEQKIQALDKRFTIKNFMNSQILQGEITYIEQLLQWVPVATWSLCYRATRDGWRSSTFHSKCDNKGATVTIIRVGSYIFGAYSDIPWGGSGWKASWNSFIFSFVNKYNLRPFRSDVYQKSQYAIYTNSGYGPTFGRGRDIYIPDNAGHSTSSHTYFGYTYRPPNGYSSGSSNTKALLAGSYKFKPSEIEVFYVN